MAKQWEIEQDRSFLYVGHGRGSTVVAWRQAARAELAAASGATYAQMLMDIANSLFGSIVVLDERRVKENAGDSV